MRILHVITGLNIGGAERMLFKCIEHSNPEMEHIVMNLGAKSLLSARLEELGVQVITLNFKSVFSFIFRFYNLVREFRKIDYDLVQGWMYHGNLASFIGNSFTRHKPVIFNVRQSISRLRDEKWTTVIVILVNAFLSWRVNGVIYNSKNSQKQHLRLGYCSSNMVFIPNGFEPTKFKKDLSRRKEFRLKWSIDPYDIVYCLVARNDPKKNIGDFLKASSVVSKKLPNSFFVIAGRNIANDKKIHDYIIINKLKGKFLVFDEVSNVEELWCAADVAVSSSIDEGFPNVIGEAMLTEVPCVVTDVGDCSMVIGKFGYTVKPKSYNALADAMLKIGMLNSKERDILGVNARKRIEEFFSINSVVSQYFKLYKNIIKS